MLFGKIKQLISSNNKTYIRNRSIILLRYLPKRYGWFNVVLCAVNKSENLAMSRSLRFRYFFRDLNVARIWSVWTRSYTLSSVVRRCRRDRGVREVFQSVRQTLYRSRRALLLSATAAYVNDDDEEAEDPNIPCQTSITDEELEALMTELESVDELSRVTLYCTSCGRRLAIDKRHVGVRYCSCKVATAENESHDGWVPYMEADDVIIWRKEYKPGQRYAYKVYGRYPEVVASDFAGVQVDGRYRRAWDAAVAALSTVEEAANGVSGQSVLHWEVMWPRMFSNRDYVYIRRHKQFNAQQKYSKHKDSLFKIDEKKTQMCLVAERPSVHSKAKRKSMESAEIEDCENKVYVIISRSCVHDRVPESKHAVRVKDYWSNMVVRSLYGSKRPGMEFVLTYYDDAGTGGLPGGVTAWATGRAAPAYLARMRRAASDYTASPQYFEKEPLIETPQKHELTKDKSTQTELPHAPIPPEKNKYDTDVSVNPDDVKLTDDSSEEVSDDEDEGDIPQIESVFSMKAEEHRIEESAEKEVKADKEDISKQIPTKIEEEDTKPEEEVTNGSWWRYLYPFYYFL